MWALVFLCLQFPAAAVQWCALTSHLCYQAPAPQGISRDFLWGCVVADPWKKLINRKIESHLVVRMTHQVSVCVVFIYAKKLKETTHLF